MRTIVHLSIAATVIGVTSCGRVPLRPDAMASINSVSVSERVAISREVNYEGPEEFAANVLGVALGQHYGSAAVKNAPATGTVLGVSLGVLVARGFVTPRAQIKTYLAENNIDVA